MSAIRTCKTCGDTYPLDAMHFVRKPTCIGGFLPTCRWCTNQRRRELNRDIEIEIKKIPAMRALRFMGFNCEQIADDLDVSTRQVELSLRETFLI